MKKMMSAAVAAAAFLCSSAHAAVLVNENFDGLATGLYGENEALGPNLVVTVGSVDVFADGGFGLPCSGGGKCMDLAGNTGARVETPFGTNFDFSQGQQITLSFGIEGSRRGDVNDFFAGMTLSDVITFSDVRINGVLQDDSLTTAYFVAETTIASDRPYGDFVITAIAEEDGFFGLFFGTTSDDAFGPLIDNVRIEVGQPTTVPIVPEPATWAMMIAGFGLVGGAMRSRRQVPAAV